MIAGVTVLQDPITILILHILIIIPHLFHHSTRHHPNRHQIMVMRAIGLILTFVLHIPPLLLRPITPLPSHPQLGGHPLILFPKARILILTREVFIMIVQTTSTNRVIHPLTCSMKMVSKVVDYQTILLRVLMWKQMQPPALLHRHQCTH